MNALNRDQYILEDHLNFISKQAIEGGLDIKNMNHREYNYKSVFKSSDFTKWLKNNGVCKDEFAAKELQKQMINHKIMNKVSPDSNLYRFAMIKGDKKPISSWHSSGLKGVVSGESLGEIHWRNKNTHLAQMYFDKSNCDLFD